MSCPGQCAQSKGGKSVKAGRASRGPACFCLARRPSPRGVGNLPSGAPPLSFCGQQGQPPQGCPQPIRWCGNSGLPLGAVLSQRGHRDWGCKGTHSSRRPVSENRRFSIRLFTRRGNSAGRPGRELQAVRLHRGRIPRPGCFNGILGPAPQDGMKAGPVHVDRACFHASMLMALTGQPSRASWAASSWPLRDAAAVGQPVVAHVEYLRAGAGAQAAADAVLIYCCVHIGHSYYSRIFPSRPSVTTCQGMNLPLCRRAVSAARCIPPQQGDIHPHDGQLPDIVAAKDLRQLFGIVSLIQLGAADQRDAAPHEPLVEVRPGISRAVRRDQQPGTVEPGASTGTSLICTGHWARWDTAPSCGAETA